MRHKTSGYFLLSALLVSLILGLCILLNLRCPQAVSDDALTQECLQCPKPEDRHTFAAAQSKFPLSYPLPRFPMPKLKLQNTVIRV